MAEPSSMTATGPAPIDTQMQQQQQQQQVQAQAQAQAQAQQTQQPQQQPPHTLQQPPQQQQPPHTLQQLQQQPQQQQPLEQPQQHLQPQQPLQHLQPLQLPLAIPPNPYQPAYYGSAPVSPHSPYGSPALGYAQPALPSPGPYSLPPQAQPYYPPQQFLAPQGPPQGYGYPQGPPPQQPGYPPQQGMYPPPQGYPQGPPQGFPQQQGFPQGYPPQGYPPQQAYYQPMSMAAQFGPILKPVSEGYTPVFAQGYMPQQDAAVIYKALGGPSVTADEEAIIHILPFLTASMLASIHHCLKTENSPPVSLADLVEKKMKSTFKDAVRAVVLGPLDFDVWLLNRALDGFGTNEVFLSMVLLGRKNGDIDAIKDAYYRKYNKYLVEVIRKKLSGELEELYMNALEARRVDEAAPVSDAQIDADAKELYAAMVGKSEGNKVSEILVTRSDAMLKRIVTAYDETLARGKPLEKMIDKKFSGGMKAALLYIVQGAKDRPLREAKALEATMKGVGTKDEELTCRIAILHWDRALLRDVAQRYKKEFPERGNLTLRVKGETSGHYGKFLLALLDVAN